MLMPKQQAWLENMATEEQLSFFREHGYLIVEGALQGEQLKRTIDVVDAVAEAQYARKANGRKSNGGGNMPKGDVGSLLAVMEGPAMLELLDNVKTFPLLWDILGWNIQLYLSSISVKPPEEMPEDGLEAAEINPSNRANGTSGYHRASPHSLPQRLRTRAHRCVGSQRTVGDRRWRCSGTMPSAASASARAPRRCSA